MAEQRTVHTDPLPEDRQQPLIVLVFGNLSKAFNVPLRAANYAANLFGVQLHDHSFLYRQVDVFAFRQAEDFSGHILAPQFQPMRSSPAAHQLERVHDLNILLHLLLDADLIALHEKLN